MIRIGIFFLLICFSCEKMSDFEDQNLSKGIEQYQLGVGEFNFEKLEENFPIYDISTVIDKYDVFQYQEKNFIPLQIMSEIFMKPVNQTLYQKRFIPSQYRIGYRFQLSTNLWVLAYLETYDLHTSNTIWATYDVQEKKILSKLIVKRVNTLNSVELVEVNGNEIRLAEECGGNRDETIYGIENGQFSRKGHASFDLNKVWVEKAFKKVNLDNYIPKVASCDTLKHELAERAIIQAILVSPVNKECINSSYVLCGRVEFSEDIWLLSIMHLQNGRDEKFMLLLYNPKKSKITSKLVVHQNHELSKIDLLSFNDNEIVLYMKYSRHFINGLEGDNSQPVQFQERFIIENDQFLKK